MRPLEATIRALCISRIGREPDLDNPIGYNDKIQWLKLHDQRPGHAQACDKWAVRRLVEERAGVDVLIPAELGLTSTRFPYIAKCSHDSGSAMRIENTRQAELAQHRLAPRLARPYGVEKGEWAYQLVPARVIAEQALPGPVIDYKFHCVHGKPAWVQVIWDRHLGKAREAIFMPDGSLTDLHMDEKMQHCPVRDVHPGAEGWAALTGLAETLAEGWRYVRVDLYWSQGKPWFGELTFWPRAGCYGSDDEPIFGELLAIDLTEKREPIVA
jgi:hypothetical protein